MKEKTDPYEEISGNYDLVMGERDEIPFLLELVKKEHPAAKSVLEIACGTAKLLEPFAKRYTVSGLDISAPLLATARRRIKQARFYHQDMTSFEIGEGFDVILCLFNSLNHLSDFSEWRKVFRQCRKHLNEGGIFICDINTPYSLEAYGQEPPRVEGTSSNIVVTEFSASKGARLEMHVRVFSHAGGDLYRLSESKIHERAYPTTQIRRELKRHFSEVRAIDYFRKKVGRHSEVLYFVCR